MILFMPSTKSKALFVFSFFLLGTCLIFPNISSAADITPPQIQSSLPTNNANNFPRDENIIMHFSENIAWGSGSIFIKKYNDDSLIEIYNTLTGNTNISNGTLTLSPSAYLPAGENLYIQIDAGAIQDTASNYFIGITNKNDFTFQIETLDTQKPQLLATTPPSLGQGVSLETELVMNFQENVYTKNGIIKIKNSLNNQIISQFPANSQMVRGSGTNVIRIDIPVELNYDSQYYVNIEGTAFEDASQNTFVGISDTTSWVFQTLHDTIDPNLVELLPDDGERKVKRDSRFTLRFDEIVIANQGKIVLVDRSNDDEEVEEIDIHSALVTGSGTTQISFHFSSPLLEDTKYAILIQRGSLSDNAGNSFIGIDSVKDWSFSTQSDIALPQNIESTGSVLGVSTINTPPPSYFEDLSDHWGKEYVLTLAEKDIITNQKYFRANDLALRSELIKMAVIAFHIPEAQNISVQFNDVDKNAWYYPFVQAAYQSNIISGFEDDSLRPNNALTRAEALKIVLNASGIKRSNYEHSFTDIEDSWLDSYVGFAFFNNIISGTTFNTFSPNAPISRIELAKIIFHVLQLKESLEM